MALSGAVQLTIWGETFAGYGIKWTWRQERQVTPHGEKSPLFGGQQSMLLERRPEEQ